MTRLVMRPVWLVTARESPEVAFDTEALALEEVVRLRQRWPETTAQVYPVPYVRRET